MVTTRAQEVSTSHAGRHRLGADLPAADPLAPQAGVPAPPLPPLPSQHQDDRIAALTMQVQSLMAAVQVLQEQPRPPSLVPRIVQPSQHSSRGRSPVREVRHRHASPRHHRQETSKRSRSPSRHVSASPKWRHGKEAERTRLHRRDSSPSSESLREGSFDGQIVRRAERRLDEYNQRLKELNRRITNPPEVDYNSRPPLSRRIMEEPISTRFRLSQLDPYDGTTDPLDHLKSYKILMQVQRATDSLLCISLLCIAFPVTLKKAARAWYSRLPSGASTPSASWRRPSWSILTLAERFLE